MIARRLEQVVFRDVAPQLIRHVKPVPPAAAEGLLKATYEQMDRDFQVVPPLTLHAAVPSLVAGVWSIARESLVAGPVSRTDREVVAVAVSLMNQCPFCVDVHATMLHGGKRHRMARRLLHGDLPGVAADEGRNLVEWAFSTRTPGANILQSPPFPSDEAPEMIGTAVAFHYVNRMVNIFLAETPIALPRRLRGLKGPIRRLAARWIGRRVIGLSLAPGDSLSLLPEAELPQAFCWARRNEAVAGAFARFSAVMEAAGRAHVPPRVRQLVLERLEAWQGDDLGLSRAWLDVAVRPLSERDQASARLALLAALAWYRIDDEIIEQFRRHDPSDEGLISTAAWASFVASRRIASWLAPGPTARERGVAPLASAGG